MRFIIFLNTILLFSTFGYGQSTYVPDDNFEQALIDLSLDDILDDYVLTESIDTVLELIITDLEIASLEGISDFTALTVLRCANNDLVALNMSMNLNLRVLGFETNNITSLDVSGCEELETLVGPMNELSSLDLSSNVALEKLVVYKNNLTELDLGSNISLEVLVVSENNLTELDLTSNANLFYLVCPLNELTSLNVTGLAALATISCEENNLSHLDLSSNISLNDFICQFNELTYLNLKNGNNLAICDECFSCVNNPDLDCVTVDDPVYSDETWINHNDHTIFSEECFLGIEKGSITETTIYPTPANTKLNVTINKANAAYKLYDIAGKLVFSGALSKGINTINVEELNTGVYFLQIDGDNYHETQKTIIK
ncbi:MAG: hypothetical protein ACI8ZM_003993 [Crocinitomix sp.]|jgi:hypothetical protein